MLAEIEVDLRCVASAHRHRRVRAIAFVAVCVVVVAGIATVGSLLLPAAGAAALCSIAGLAVGAVLAVGYRRERLP